MFSSTYPPRSLSEFAADCRRLVLGAAYALRPSRTTALLPIAKAVLVSMLRGRPEYPPFLKDGAAQPEPVEGFVGLCGDLSPEELVAGFGRGYYPMSHIGRKKWWRLEERMVMAPHEMVREKDVRRLLRARRFNVTFDEAFTEVMNACAEPRPRQVPLTWITPDIVDAYERLHRRGHAHSFEAWNARGELVGGGFGIAVGPVFVIESQFTRERNASKVAMATLLRHLTAWNFALVDGKSHTPHLERLGFRLVPQDDYLDALQSSPPDEGDVGCWVVDPDLDASKDWSPAPPPKRSMPGDADAAAPTRSGITSAGGRA